MPQKIHKSMPSGCTEQKKIVKNREKLQRLDVLELREINKIVALCCFFTHQSWMIYFCLCATEVIIMKKMHKNWIKY